MPTASRILEDKARHAGVSLVTVGPDTTVLEAAVLMNDHRIGALMVTDVQGRAVGIFTERDVLTRVVAEGRAPESVRVSEVMTKNPIVCSPDTTMDDIRRTMRDRRIRHLPVVSDDGLVGLISIGDINAAETRELTETVLYLEQFMSPR